jgi:SNF2 family DNA or RNA helicase
MKDSIEEKIQELKLKKSNAFDALFAEESESELAKEKSFSGKLSYSDFEFLIK